MYVQLVVDSARVEISTQTGGQAHRHGHGIRPDAPVILRCVGLYVVYKEFAISRSHFAAHYVAAKPAEPYVFR